MIKIILPDGTKVYQMQIDDYVEPKKNYYFKFTSYPRIGITRKIRWYFQQKRILKARKYNTRKSKKHQNYTLLDFISGLYTTAQPSIVEKHEDHYQNRCKKTKTGKRQITLMDFIDCPPTNLKEVNTKFIDRFPPVPSVQYDDFCLQAGLKEDWVFFQEVSEFNGLFRHMLLLNSFIYWDGIEEKIRLNGFKLKGYSVQEMIKWDLLRHSLCIRFYTQFADIAISLNKSGLIGVFDEPERVPQPHHFSYYYSFLEPKHFMEFFLRLVKECIQYKIIIPRIAEGDGVFIHSWAGNFTTDKDGNPTDPDASITVHDKKFYGKGFTTIVIVAWCGSRWLPVYCKTYKGSVSENKVYREVMEEFLSALPYDWKVIGYDKGADSIDNRKFNKKKKLIGTIPARKNIKYDVLVEIGDRRYFIESDIPLGMSIKKFGRLYDHRAQAEPVFSPIGWAYNMKGMNQMGLGSARIHIIKYLSILLLHALTAYKVNREDLIMSAKAFTRVSL